jgi:hypothetical protein
LESLTAYKKGIYNEDISALGPEKARQHQLAAAAFIDMYSAPLADVIEVRKNRKLLADKFKAINYNILGAPITGR